MRISNELKNSELKALQMQINPHFLFNTLNMIAKTAYMETAECTALLLECTASLLRYTLDNSMQPVPLEKELGMLKNYVSIQENRFGERIQFHFQLDKSLNQIQIPRLILQPVLENAITHGVGMKIVGAQIQIQTYRKDGCCVLTVFDNGQGMEQEDLEQVRKKMKEKCSGGEQVGLRNIYYRLRYFYGTEADLQIESKVEQGTKVTIIIPILPNQETEEANV